MSSSESPHCEVSFSTFRVPFGIWIVGLKRGRMVSLNLLMVAGSCGALQSHQYPQSILNLRHRAGRNATPALDEAVFADRSDGFAEERGGLGETAFGWLDDDVEGDVSQCGGDGDHHHEIGAALIEEVH